MHALDGHKTQKCTNVWICSLDDIEYWFSNTMAHGKVRQLNLLRETVCVCVREMVSEGELSTNECKLLEQIYRHASTHPQKPAHRRREEKFLCVIVKLEKYFALLPFRCLYWRLKMYVYGGFHTFFTEHESLYRITWTHMQYTSSAVCIRTKNIPFQLKVKQYHLNVTTESGGVYQFQGTGWKWRCVIKLAE